MVTTPDAWPTGRKGRSLALGITLVMAAIIWVLIAEPLLAWHVDLRQAVENRGAVARRMEAVAESLPELRVRSEEAAARGSAVALTEGSTDALAGAALQARLRDFAARSQLQLNSTETLAAEDAGGIRRIGVRISTIAPWPVLVRLLRELDEASPRLLVDDLQLQASVSLAAGSAGPLTASFTVLAFRAATP
jgi:general secretion pathway protein M